MRKDDLRYIRNALLFPRGRTELSNDYIIDAVSYNEAMERLETLIAEPAVKHLSQIVRDCNHLARILYQSMGCVVEEGYRFDRADHPQEQGCWNAAVLAYDFIEGTDVEEALSSLGEDELFAGLDEEGEFFAR